MGSEGFVPGLVLSRRLFESSVRRDADALLGEDRYAAALLGPGSEVLGLDSERSTDHDWAARVQLFVDAADLDNAKSLERPGEVLVTTVGAAFTNWIGWDPATEITLLDWLAAPSNALLMVTAGTVFHDGVGDLTRARAAVAWYPTELWQWMLGCQWRRIAEEHAFVGRAAEAGDDLGSRILTARLARDCIRLAFLIERRYAPYSKWLGSAVTWLRCGDDLHDLLSRAVAASDAEERQARLGDSYELLGRLTNELALTPPLDPKPRPFYTRPYTVGAADELATALLDAVADPTLRALRPHGAFDQLFDSTHATWPVAKAAYRALLDETR
jgi:hypothetical protein